MSSEFFRKEDWWAVWIGLAFVVAASILATHGTSLRFIAVAPQRWKAVSELLAQWSDDGLRYAALAGVWGFALGIGAMAQGTPFKQFLPGFVVVYAVAIVLYGVGAWDKAAHYNLEPPLVALGLGLAIANLARVPRWLEPALRVEFYIKTGIVLLGASLPMTLIAWAGPVAIAQAAIVSLVTFAVIYFTAIRLGVDRRFAATLGTGGAVCGVSGAIAVGGAVGAKKQDVSIAISLVVLWAIVMIAALPLAARALRLPTGVAGAWIGTSEFADAAGLAAAQSYGGYAGNLAGIAGSADAAVTAFTLMKVVGRDAWIGVWAFVLSFVAATRWERTGVETRANAAQIWDRFPKFVLGFLLASALVTLVAHDTDYAAYRKSVVPALVAPLQLLRTWAFTFAFLSIGLTTRIRAFAAVGRAPFYAFTVGVLVNLVLGYVLSTQVFAEFWRHLG